jgi:PKHD-type hydroxylase
MKYLNICNDPWYRAKTTCSWVYWDGVFTNEELNHIEAYCDSYETHLGTTFGADSEDEYKKHRVSDVRFFERELENEWIFNRLNQTIENINAKFYGFDLNGYKMFQYTKYDSSKVGRYDWHTDMEFDTNHHDGIEPRKLSITIPLNEDYEGGQFQLNMSTEDNPHIVEQRRGRVIAFPSFLLHRVTPLTRGIRKSIVIWVVGPKFR